MVLADAVPVVIGVVRVRVLGGFVRLNFWLGLELELGDVGLFRSVCVVVHVIVRGSVGIVAITIVVIVMVVRLRRSRRRLFLPRLLRFILSGLENVLPIPICISQLSIKHTITKRGAKDDTYTNPAQGLLLLLPRQSRRSIVYYALIHSSHRALLFYLVTGHVSLRWVILPCTRILILIAILS